MSYAKLYDARDTGQVFHLNYSLVPVLIVQVVSKVQASVCNLPAEDRSRELIIVALTIDGFAASLVFLRLLNKHLSGTSWGLDDVVITATVVCWRDL